MGGRDLAVGMSRWDRSPVGNGCGEGFPEPLQGLDGVCLRVSHVSAHRSQMRPRSCGDMREGAICGVWSYHLFNGVKTWNRLRLVELEKFLPHRYIPILKISQPIFAGHNIKSRKENSINIVYVVQYKISGPIIIRIVQQ